MVGFLPNAPANSAESHSFSSDDSEFFSYYAIAYAEGFFPSALVS